MGQGTFTGLATLLAEELDADWDQVRVEGAPCDLGKYKNLLMGLQATGGSTAMANSFEQMRKAGALARAMLVAAAAEEWRVPAEFITVEKGWLHAKDGRRARFGQLAARAAKQPIPQSAPLKDPKDFQLIGRSKLHRKDHIDKTDGTAVFTQDHKLPDMLIAVVAHPRRFGAVPKMVNADRAKAVPNVVEVVPFDGDGAVRFSGVAVLAKNTWAARSGRDALEIDWDESQAFKLGSAEILAQYKEMARKDGLVTRREGDVAAAFSANPARLIEAEYELPYLAHAAMEPMNCLVQLGDGRCEIWNGEQFHTADQGAIAASLKIPVEKVILHQLYAGGSFGRRANAGSDYIVEAVSIAKAYGADGTPIKLQWTREDDLHGGLYRPMYFHKLEAGLNDKKELIGWRHVIVGQSILGGTPFEPVMVKNGIDATSVEGAANVAYEIPNIDVELSTTKSAVPVLWWRVVGSSHTTFAVEAFIDEVAYAAGKDPFAFRRDLLEKEPRMKAVLELAADKAGWSSGPLPKGKGRGIAVCEAFKSFVAQAAEVTVDEAGQVTVDRVVCAVDCGIAVNPDVIAAQMEGGIGFGLGAVLYGAITLKDGRVEQDNFNGYRVLRINEMPKVEVHIVPSAEAPTGVGEPGVAPIGPAVANAIFAATGTRVHLLPFPRPIKT